MPSFEWTATRKSTSLNTVNIHYTDTIGNQKSSNVSNRLLSVLLCLIFRFTCVTVRNLASYWVIMDSRWMNVAHISYFPHNHCIHPIPTPQQTFSIIRTLGAATCIYYAPNASTRDWMHHSHGRIKGLSFKAIILAPSGCLSTCL